ncbi:hypothetical protein HDU98_007289 [Podochytrium sp. JEL0797]|nr:hypothetical protein HDU98_007289 [Podochytrium sp. JEL0797]
MIAPLLITLATLSTALPVALDCPKPPLLAVFPCSADPHFLATLPIDQNLPNRAPFSAPATVNVCYSKDSIHLTMKATKEPTFFVNSTLGHNDDIWAYTVMEAFMVNVPTLDIDPQTYLELEVSPTNQTYTAFTFNPSKVRAPGAPFDHFFIGSQTSPEHPSCFNGECAVFDGFNAHTTMDRPNKTWESQIVVPLSLFNVRQPAGTQWRMNFFRTTYDPEMKVQQYGAWNAPDVVNFHVTPCFGDVLFF